jgi:hypothetical protein
MLVVVLSACHSCVIFNDVTICALRASRDPKRSDHYEMRAQKLDPRAPGAS